MKKIKEIIVDEIYKNGNIRVSVKEEWEDYSYIQEYTNTINDKPLLLQIEESLLKINDTFIKIEDWEISPIVAYKSFKKMNWIIDNALKLIERQTRNMIEDSPLENKEFRISVRKTYDFKSSDYYNSKVKELNIEENKKELKEVEKLIKTATDMDKTLFDDNWEAIEKVDVKFNQILSYTPKKD